MEQNDTIKLYKSDAWLLQSIMYSHNKDNSINPKGIIRAGDMINHSIFNYEEINPGIHRLIGHGYLSYIDGTVFITPNAIALSSKIRLMRRGRVGEMQIWKRKLNTLPYPIKDNEPYAGIEYIPYTVFQEAVSKYCIRFWVDLQS